MKKLLILLAAMPLLFACNIDTTIKLSPTIKGFSYSKDGACILGDATAENAFTAFIIAESKFGSQKVGKTVDCQVQLSGNKYSGKQDKLGIYTFQDGKLTWSSSGATIVMDSDYKALNGTWSITVTDNGDKATLKNGSKQLKLKFWHETD